MDTLPHFILGTAGHIDHGKSTLVRYLTGVDPDRLAEEKRRGITIELGFAELNLPNGTHLGIVDVPGHERFVRHMVEGATGIDVALLVVAADDGVMVQTREHLSILELLGVRHLVVAISKIDMTGDELAELAALDVAELLRETPFNGAEIVPVSGITGEGVHTLTAALERATTHIMTRSASGAVRLPVDRVFSIGGAGTVVTGTLWEGTVAPGDSVELGCCGKTARVRSVQVHGVECSRARAGQRVALNLSGVKREEVSRGDILATPGTLRESGRFNSWLKYVGTGESSEGLKNGQRVHIHHGTRELPGRVKLLYAQDEQRPGSLSAGESAFAQIVLDDDTRLPVRRGDRFIVRSVSPAYTIAGGVVLELAAEPRVKLSTDKLAYLALIREGELEQAAVAFVEVGRLPSSSDEVAVELNSEKAMVAAALNQSELARLKTESETFYLSSSVLDDLKQRIEHELLAYHDAHPKALEMNVRALRDLIWPPAKGPGHARTCAWSPTRFEALLQVMATEGTVILEEGKVRHPRATSSVQALHAETRARLRGRIESQGLSVESVSELAAGLSQSRDLIAQVLGQMTREGDLIRLVGEYHFTPNHITAAEKVLRKALSEKGDAGISAAEARDLWQVSRKYAIPLLEYFDAQGVTQRVGEVRVLALTK